MTVTGNSIAVTGHQPFLLGGYGVDVAEKLVALAQDWLETHRPREVVSGLAAGWDTTVAEAAFRAKIPLVAALAFDGQADAWPQDAQDQQARLIQHAAHVYVYAPQKEHGCYARRDRWVLERGDTVLALWSGAEGGTARAVAKAHEMGKPVVNLWDAWARLA